MAKPGGSRKVTEEIAEFIRKKHSEGYRHKKIKEMIDEAFGIHLHEATITRYYRPWSEVKERYKEIARKQKRERYDRIYHRHSRRMLRYLDEFFKEGEELSFSEIAESIRRKTGICFKIETLKKKIEAYVRSGRLVLEEIQPGVYRRIG